MKWFLLIFVWLCTPVWAGSPASVQLSYDLYKDGSQVGKIEEIYTRDNDRYTLTSTTTPFGFFAIFKIVFTSSGSVTTQGLRPLHFDDNRHGNSGKNSQAEFDWASKQLTLVRQEQRTQLALPDGTQDRLSAMYQFMFLALDHADTVSFAMTNGNKLDNYRYAIVSQQKLDTPAGQLDTLYLDSQAKPGENRTEIWLSTRQHNLPCKMIVTDAQGGQYMQVLSELKITP